MKKQKMIWILLLFAGIMAAHAAFTPNGAIIKGTVTDEVTKQPIAFANVVLTRNGTVTGSGAVTKDDGTFTISNIPPGTYDVQFTMVGYMPSRATKISLVANQTKIVNAAMRIQQHQLEAVMLEAKKNKRVKTAVVSKEESITDYESNNYSAPPPVSQGTFSLYNKQLQLSSPASYPVEEFNTEEYQYIKENDFQDALRVPLSTFSIDVDPASYANVRRFLNKGTLPPADAVRTEELINYFRYQYPQPQGDVPFSITTEAAECPWNKNHRLVSIALQGKNIPTENLPPSNLVFLVDVSGSMYSQDKLPLLKKSLRLLVSQMRAQDKISLVVYAGNAGLVLPATSGQNKEEIIAAIESLEAGGSTAGGAGIQLAYKVAQENMIANGNNRVILATDGDFNVGVSSDGELIRLIEKKRESGVFLTVLGFGSGNLKDSKMEQLADKGNGNYSYIDNLMEAKKVLVSEMGGTLFTLAKDVKLQIEFNPAAVKSYKLIGYENRLLADRDFNDDTKDAGELGSGHTVTALYEIVPAGSNENSGTIDPLKYQSQQKPVANESDELMTVKFRYKAPNSDTSKLISAVVKNKFKKFELATENFRFASAVATFGLSLRNAKYKGDADFNMAISIARNAKGADANGDRAEFIRLVEMATMLAEK